MGSRRVDDERSQTFQAKVAERSRDTTEHDVGVPWAAPAEALGELLLWWMDELAPSNDDGGHK